MLYRREKKMTYDELKDYILHYIKKDKTHSAIMLDGEWGTGKSYFIEHELVPFLKNESDYKTVVVSLYGIENVKEISKAIYCELRLNKLKYCKLRRNKLKKTSEVFRTSEVIANTIVKGATSFFSIDLSLNDKKLQKMYDSVDLSNKLIILEDVERTMIPIDVLMGYVNNLVEHDGVKVLMVSNEEAIINKENEDDSEEPTEYQKIKEKTISDTIRFNCDLSIAIKKILDEYDNLKKYKEEDKLNEIIRIMKYEQCYNLRTFLFACQKSSDIIERIGHEDVSSPEDFKDNIFFSVLWFSFELKSGKTINYQTLKNKSSNLEFIDPVVYKYPLFKFCYDYIVSQELNMETVVAESKVLKEMRVYDTEKSKDDADIAIINNWAQYPEKRVVEALNKISERLKNKDDISFYEYGKLAMNLCILSDILNYDIEPSVRMLEKNSIGLAKRVDPSVIFRFCVSDNDEVLKDKFLKVRKRIVYSMKSFDSKFNGFDYTIERLNEWCDYVSEKESYYKYEGRFAKELDVEKFLSLYLSCSSADMFKIRHMFCKIYDSIVSNEEPNGEKVVLIQIKNGIEKGLEISKLDKIQRKQCSWFIEQLNRYCEYRR